MRIYIAAPLFNEMERLRNEYFKRELESIGFEVYLPQEKAGISYDLISRGAQKEEVRRNIFQNDVSAVKSCDIMLCLLDGRVPDEGMCVELGIAYALEKKCLGFKTDNRAMDKYGDNNIILDGCLLSIYTDIESLKKDLFDFFNEKS